MINRDIKRYLVFEYDTEDAYGQRKLLKDSGDEVDEIQMAIYTTSQSIQDNINYKNASYVGFTNYQDEIKSTYAIKYGDVFLKVLYVNPQGRMKQVFMSEI